jgi:hypothetical protein
MSDFQNLKLVFLVQVCGVSGGELRNLLEKPFEILGLLNTHCKDEELLKMVKLSLLEEGLNRNISKVKELLTINKCHCSQIGLLCKHQIE